MKSSSSNRFHIEGFKLESRNKFFEINRWLVDHEIRPGRTLTLLTQVDLTEVEHIRDQTPPNRSPSYTTFVIKAVAMALRDYPYANRRICEVGIWPFARMKLQTFGRRDVAVVIEREFPEAEGIAFVDVIRDADEAYLEKIHTELQSLSKVNSTPSSERLELSNLITRFPSWIAKWLIHLSTGSPKQWLKYRGGAVMVSSPAKFGVDAVVATWSHPIGVSFGLVKTRPVVVDHVVVARPTFFLSLNFDRRVMTGAKAAQFFNRIVEILEKAHIEMKPFLLEEAPPTREDFPTLNEPSSKL